MMVGCLLYNIFMNLHGGEQESRGGQTFDLLVTLGCTAVAGLFGERAYDAVAHHIPEAGVAASGLGFVALTFTGIAIYHFDRFRRPPSG
jgi:hypothetical protein